MPARSGFYNERNYGCVTKVQLGGIDGGLPLVMGSIKENVPDARKGRLAKVVGGNIIRGAVLRNRVIHRVEWRAYSFPTRAGQELTAVVLCENTK